MLLPLNDNEKNLVNQNDSLVPAVTAYIKRTNAYVHDAIQTVKTYKKDQKRYPVEELMCALNQTGIISMDLRDQRKIKRVLQDYFDIDE